MSAADMLDAALDQRPRCQDCIYVSHRDGVRCKVCGDPFYDLTGAPKHGRLSS